MPAYIPTPEGMELPAEGESFAAPVTFEVREGRLYATEVDGVAIPEDAEPEADEEAPESADMEQEEFVAAVEREMQAKMAGAQ